MYIINKITQILVIVFVVLVLICIGLVVGYLLMKRKRRNSFSADAGIDYDRFERKNSLDYVKLDDIFDDMIIAEDYTRFIAVIRCQGFDFYYAHVASQYSTQTGYRGFMNTVSEPITYRQYTKAVDMEKTQNNYIRAYKELQDKLYNLSEDYKAAKKRLRESEEKKGILPGEQDEETAFMLDNLLKMQKRIEALEWRLLHVKDQLVFIEQISQSGGLPNREETYVMDWIYNPLDFPVELTREQIIEKAKLELKRIVREKINALSTSGVKAYRCTTDELIDMNRRHFQPYSADRYKIRDINKNAYYDDIISMEGKDELKKMFDEELTMEIVESLQKEFLDGESGFTDLNSVEFEVSGKEAGGYV